MDSAFCLCVRDLYLCKLGFSFAFGLDADAVQ